MSGGQKFVTDNIKKKFTVLKEQLDEREDECCRLRLQIKEHEEKHKGNETELNGLSRRIQLMEDELESTTERLNTASTMLDEASKAADESERARKVLENCSNTDSMRNCELEKLAKSYRQQADEWQAKYEEAARKLAITEVDLERAEARLEAAEKKLHESDCQLESFSSSIKSFQIAIDKASQREETYEETIRDLTERLKDLTAKYDELNSNYRAAVRQINQLEEECETWKQRYDKAKTELDSTLAELGEM